MTDPAPHNYGDTEQFSYHGGDIADDAAEGFGLLEEGDAGESLLE